LASLHHQRHHLQAQPKAAAPGIANTILQLRYAFVQVLHVLYDNA
jgi:hypothetical protein